MFSRALVAFEVVRLRGEITVAGVSPVEFGKCGAFSVSCIDALLWLRLLDCCVVWGKGSLKLWIGIPISNLQQSEREEKTSHHLLPCGQSISLDNHIMGTVNYIR